MCAVNHWLVYVRVVDMKKLADVSRDGEAGRRSITKVLRKYGIYDVI